MAYTYDDFVNAANKSGMMSQFDDNDLSLTQQHPEYGLSLLSLKNDYNNAKTDEQRLLINETANQLRNSYGSLKTTTGTTTGTTGTAAGTAAAQTGNNVAGIPTQSSFSYDMASDPSYQAYRKQYLREGDRATAQALGQASAASAGRPSSYAVTAATQAGDYYAGQMGDKVPELYENAYNRYLTDEKNKASNMQGAYENLAAQITSYGYQPNEQELAQAGMTSELAQQMYKNWIYSNPDAAYMQGALTPEEYYTLTGKWPNGYSTGGGGTTSNWMDEYNTIVNDPSVTTGAINSWVTKQVGSGNITPEVGRLITISGANRAADSNSAYQAAMNQSAGSNMSVNDSAYKAALKKIKGK